MRLNGSSYLTSIYIILSMHIHGSMTSYKQPVREAITMNYLAIKAPLEFSGLPGASLRSQCLDHRPWLTELCKCVKNTVMFDVKSKHTRQSVSYMSVSFDPSFMNARIMEVC